jgi:hypothetical protein
MIRILGLINTIFVGLSCVRLVDMSLMFSVILLDTFSCNTTWLQDDVQRAVR